MDTSFPKIVVIVGPTASGKSDVAITLARAYNGEIISADSRQVYRGMDIGTGKVPRDFTKMPNENPKKDPFYSEGIVHHLIDVASPKRSYNVTHFIRDAKKSIADIRKRGKTPIICGGTGFWVQALIDDVSFPSVKPNTTLRKKLAKLSTEALFSQLQKKDKERAKAIDQKNKIRIIRALEIIETLGAVPPKRTIDYREKAKNYLIIAINPPQKTISHNIATRLDKRLRQGMLAEARKLRADNISWNRLESFGLEYKYMALFLQKKISRAEMRNSIESESRHYAKRQLTWLRRFEKLGAPIHWVTQPKEIQMLIEKL